MTKILILIFIISQSDALYAQSVIFNWAKQTGGIGASVNGHAITTDAAGNVYTTGYFQGTVDFDPGAAVFNLSTNSVGDIYVCKLGAAGNLIWAKQIAGTAGSSGLGSAIHVDFSGNVYITGSFNGSFDFDPGFGIFTMNTSLLPNVFISKFDASGNFIWAKQMAGSSDSYGMAISSDALGNVYTTGYFGGSIDFDPGPSIFLLSSIDLSDVFISKLDGAGNFIWAKQMGGNGRDECYSLSVDIAGNVYTTGMLQADIYGYAGNIFVSKSDAGGNTVWTRQWEAGAKGNSGISVVADESGDVYATGNFSGMVRFNPPANAFSLTTAGDEDIFIARLDMDGNFVWARQLGGTGFDQGMAMALDVGGEPYITGNSAGTIDYESGICADYSSSVNQRYLFISKLDKSGNFIWTKQMEEEGSGETSSIALDAVGNVYTTGAFNGRIDFDPGNAIYNLSSVGVYDNFIHKMSPCLNSSVSDLTISSCNSYTLNCHLYSLSGVYIQKLPNTAGCDSTITLHLTIGKDGIKTNLSQTICSGDSYAGYTTTGVYTDTLKGAAGCDSIRILSLAVEQKPHPDLGSDKILCTGTVLMLEPGAFSSYLWQDGSTGSSYTVKHAGTYSLKVTSSCGSAEAKINITEKDCNIVFPSAFSPNNDGLNDEFKILHAPVLADYNLSVYSRWGQKVFETGDYAKGWDGMVNGGLSAPGVYVWFCRFRRTGDLSDSQMKGTVVLVR